MIDEQLQEEASLYVLGALEPDEARAFEAQLAGNEELRRHVDELSDTVAQLALAAPPHALPPNLEGRILAEIRATTKPVSAPAFRAAWIPWAIAACLALACVIAFAERQRLTIQLAKLRDQNTQAEARVADAQTRMENLAAEKYRAEQQVVELREREADARAQMATLAATRDDLTNKLAQREARDAEGERRAREDRDARASQQPPEQLAGPTDRDDERDGFSNIQVATLTSKMTRAPNATAAIVWDAARQRGVLNMTNVPPNAPERDYQLWIVDPRFADPVSAGVFRVERSGATRYVFTPKVRIESATAFAVSLERKGGVAKAEGPIVLASK